MREFPMETAVAVINAMADLARVHRAVPDVC
jgi:hypothetical protein